MIGLPQGPDALIPNIEVKTRGYMNLKIYFQYHLIELWLM